VTDEKTRAAESKARAEQALAEAEARRDEVKEVGEQMTYLRIRNHFGEMMLEAMTTRKGKAA
jgi:uncharacterized membrane protein YdbT with pleckstrin-like domain